MKNDKVIDTNRVSRVFGNAKAVEMLNAAITTEVNLKLGVGNEIGVFYIDMNKADPILSSGQRTKAGSLIQGGFNHSISEKGSPVNAKFSSQPQTQQFKRWFGKSKIVNEDGTPKVVYHATKADFTQFDPNLQGKNFMGWSELGKGFYFSTSEKGAREYVRGDDTKIIQAYLKAENPLNAKAKTPTKLMDALPYSTSMSDLRTAQSSADMWIIIAQLAKINVQETLRKNGYDGIYSIYPDGTGQYVVFEPTQIKSATDNIGLFDPENTDIRYSMREDDKNVKASLDTMQAVFQQTRGHHMNAVEAEKLASWMRKEFNSEMDVDEAAERIARAYNLAESIAAPTKSTTQKAQRQSERAALEQMDEELYSLAKDMLGASKSLNQEHEERAKPIREYLRKTSIALTDNQWAEAASQTGSVGAYRRALFGRVRLNNEGTSLDSLWSELSDMDAEFFPKDASESDMPRLLLAAVDNLRPQYDNEYGMVAEQMAQYVTMRMNQEYLKLPGVKAAAKEQAALGMNVQEYGRAVRAFQDESKAEFDKALGSIRDAKKLTGLVESAQRDMALREKYRAWRDEDIEKQKIRENRQKDLNGIERDAGALLSMLEKPTDKRHVPDRLKETVMRFLSALDFDGDTEKQRNLADRIQVLAGELDKLERSGDAGIGGAIDQDVINGLNELAQKTRNLKGITDLDEKSLSELRQWVGVIRHAVATANDLHDQGRKATVARAGEDTIAELGGKKDVSTRQGMQRLIDELMNAGMVDAAHFFEQLGGAARSAYQGVRDGFDKQVRYLEASRSFLQKAAKGIDIRSLGGKKAKKQRFDVAGGTLELTKGNIMELYCLNKREQAQGHLYEGLGVRMNEKGVDPVKLTRTDVKAITDTLTAEEKVLADKIQQFMSTKCADWGNVASMELYGYKKFGEKDYYPIKVDRNTVKTNEQNQTGQEDNAGLYTIKNFGMTKAAQEGAKNPLLLGDIFDTFTNHIDQMSRYSAYVVPLMDMMRWYNYQNGEYGASVKKSIERAFGMKGKKYIEQFVRDVNGATISRDASEEVFDKLTRNAKIAAVGMNLRVTIQQPTAYVRAAAEISPKYLTEGLAHKAQVELAKKYCPIALWKSWGFFEISTGRSLRELVVGDQGAMDTLREKGTWLAGKADELTWGKLWNACASEQSHLHPEMDTKSEPFYQLVGQRLSEIVDKTQVVDSVFHRTQQMRSKSGVAKMYTAFMSEPMKTYNMLRSAIADYAQNRNKATGARLARIMSVWVATGVATAIAAGIVDAMRNSDEDKDFWEKWLEASAENTVDNLNPLEMLPVAKEVLSIMDGYDPSRMDMQSIQRFIEIGDELKGIIVDGKETTWSLYKWLYKVSQFSGSATGLPLAGMVRDTAAIAQTITGKPISPQSPAASMSHERKTLYNAIKAGDDKLVEKIRTRLSTRKQNPKSPAEIDDAIGYALFESKDPRIQAAWEARAEGRTRDMDAIRKEIVAEGFTGEMVDKAIKKYGDSVAVEDEKEKDMTKQLKVRMWSSDDLHDVMLRAYDGGSLEDVKFAYRERKDDSDAKDPESSMVSEIKGFAKKDYLEAIDKGQTQRAQKVAATLQGVIGMKQADLDAMTKDWRVDHYYDGIKAYAEGDNKPGYTKLVAAYKRELTDAAYPDSVIGSKLISSYRQKVYDAWDRGDNAWVTKLFKRLENLNLRNGEGGKYNYFGPDEKRGGCYQMNEMRESYEKNKKKKEQATKNKK